MFYDASGAVVSGPMDFTVTGPTCDVINWGTASSPWCRNASGCTAPPAALDSFWHNGTIMVLEVSHSDIFWLGNGNDMKVDSDNIAKALDMMKTDSEFAWQHECMVILRAFLAYYPDRRDELVQRMSEGRFDIGATFSEPLEETLYGELLVRQMYLGRKWFVDNFPGVDSAVVAFHQDGPLRALQMPQIYAKAGVKYVAHFPLVHGCVSASIAQHCTNSFISCETFVSLATAIMRVAYAPPPPSPGALVSICSDVHTCSRVY